MACSRMIAAPLPELAAHVDVGGIALDSEGREGRALDQLVRVLIDDLVVVEGARLGLVAVAEQVAREETLGQKAPLQAGGEAGAAAAAQARP